MEIDTNRDDDVVKIEGEAENINKKEVVATDKVVPLSRPLPPFLQILS